MSLRGYDAYNGQCLRTIVDYNNLNTIDWLQSWRLRVSWLQVLNMTMKIPSVIFGFVTDNVFVASHTA